MKIACWSGPRNISTAMMYAFGNRADMTAVDEPFYAAYLDRTGLSHPMRTAVLESQSRDPAQVIAALRAPDPTPHAYHKHMTQQLLPDIPRDWFGAMRHVVLIRHPMRVVASFAAKYERPTLSDIGFVQQQALYDQLQAEGHNPLVLDSADIRRNPEGMLRRLCDVLGLDWDPAMLCWPSGPKPCDGVWAPVWYGAVHASTGFAGPEGDLPRLDGDLKALAEAAMPAFEALSRQRLRP